MTSPHIPLSIQNPERHHMHLPPLHSLRTLLQHVPSADPAGWLYLRQVPETPDETGFFHVDAADEIGAVADARARAWADAGWVPYVPVEEVQELLRLPLPAGENT